VVGGRHPTAGRRREPAGVTRPVRGPPGRVGGIRFPRPPTGPRAPQGRRASGRPSCPQRSSLFVGASLRSPQSLGPATTSVLQHTARRGRGRVAQLELEEAVDGRRRGRSQRRAVPCAIRSEKNAAIRSRSITPLCGVSAQGRSSWVFVASDHAEYPPYSE